MGTQNPLLPSRRPPLLAEALLQARGEVEALALAGLVGAHEAAVGEIGQISAGGEVVDTVPLSWPSMV